MTTDITQSLRRLEGLADLESEDAQLILRTLAVLLESRCERHAPYQVVDEMLATLILPWALGSQVSAEDEKEIVVMLTEVAATRPNATGVIHTISKADYSLLATAIRELLARRGQYDGDESEALVYGLSDLKWCGIPQVLVIVRSDHVETFLASVLTSGRGPIARTAAELLDWLKTDRVDK